MLNTDPLHLPCRGVAKGIDAMLDGTHYLMRNGLERRRILQGTPKTATLPALLNAQPTLLASSNHTHYNTAWVRRFASVHVTQRSVMLDYDHLRPIITTISNQKPATPTATFPKSFRSIGLPSGHSRHHDHHHLSILNAF